ncbi:MAG: hypothetical protein KDA42_12555 [Planctomycetales bacterium]|nr:hypothetical protein [Planctomycetales bacterium]
MASGCAPRVHPEEQTEYQALAAAGAEMDLNPAGRIASVELSRTPATDNDLRHLEGLSHVWCVSLYDTSITDAGLAHVRGLGNLKWLDVENTRVTAQGLRQLTGLKKLITVWIGGLDISDDEIRQLQEAMPATTFRR